MRELGVDVLLLSVGPDLPYLTGYEAMPLERLTMFVLPQQGDPVLLVPRLEAPRVEEHPHLFAVETWDETDDPVARVAAMAGPVGCAAIGDQTWARFVLALQQALPSTRFVPARDVTASLRIVKDADEIDALRRAAQAVDHIAAAMRSEPFAGRREHDRTEHTSTTPVVRPVRAEEGVAVQQQPEGTTSRTAVPAAMSSRMPRAFLRSNDRAGFVSKK